MKDQIQIRYTKESSAGSNLSCGGNLSYLDLVPGQTILDLGCGRGRETIEAALALGPDGLASVSISQLPWLKRPDKTLQEHPKSRPAKHESPLSRATSNPCLLRMRHSTP